MAMKYRQLKKLCKKAALLVKDKHYKFEFCSDWGMHVFHYSCGGYDCNDWDTENAWRCLESLFWDHHTLYSHNEMEYVGPKSTTINVLNWAKQHYGGSPSKLL